MSEDMNGLPKLYRELAGWWPVLSTPEDYKETCAVGSPSTCQIISRLHKQPRPHAVDDKAWHGDT